MSGTIRFFRRISRSASRADVSPNEGKGQDVGTLYFEPSKSVFLSFSINTLSSDEAVSKDANAVKKSMETFLLPAPDTRYYLFRSSEDRDSCTKMGIEKEFKEKAKEVGPNGVLFFMFSGHGNDKGIAAVDEFIDGEDDLLQWVKHAQWNETKYIVFIFDSCGSGGVVESLTKGPSNPIIIAMSSCGQNETCRSLSTLDQSIFSYFLAYVLHQYKESFKLEEIYHKCAKLSTLMCSLMVGAEMHPELRFSNLEAKDPTYAYEQHIQEIESLRARESLSNEAEKWLFHVKHYTLSIMSEEFRLWKRKKFVNAVLLSMIESVAEFEKESKCARANDPQMFIIVYTKVVRAVVSTPARFYMEKFTTDHVLMGLSMYYMALKTDPKLNRPLLDLINEIFSLRLKEEQQKYPKKTNIAGELNKEQTQFIKQLREDLKIISL